MPYRLLQPPASRRKDASMGLLTEILEHPVDPEYARVAVRDGVTRTPRGRLALLLVAVVSGIMFALSAAQVTSQAPALETERARLIDQVKQAEHRQDTLRAQAASLRTENDGLRAAALGEDDEAKGLRARLEILGPTTGDRPVRGPGVTIICDDAPAPAVDGQKGDRVLDRDLQELVNGLWYAGAEAVSINGHRISTLSAIRGAGDAITVNYRSLTRPYKVEAIGDPRTLPARFGDAPAGRLWHGLHQNYGLRFEFASATELNLPADSGLVLRHAEEVPR